MYIKQVSIDGFKSYAHRTDIVGFDPQFNAITGLNGSGKSNILDAICFVLGISNLSQVRAGNLQDLVYKSGQAGITKATVSIVFDNSDKNQSPLGYDHFQEITVTRTIVVGGRNKYLINGINANNQRVVDLFRSVQLNVNNPHFLIMQGRITKVLNMKPPEILSMVEEAAGTRMYEAKRLTALTTIKKKDTKLDEINSVIREEIEPKLKKMEQERKHYQEYQKVQREAEHLGKVTVAFQYFRAKEACTQHADIHQKKVQEVQDLQNRQSDAVKRIEALEGEIVQLNEKLRTDSDRGSELHKLEEELKQRQNEESTALSALDNKKASLKTNDKRCKDLQKGIAADKKLLATKEKELADLRASFQELENQGRKDEEAVASATKQLQALAAGMYANEDGEAATLASQLIQAKQKLSGAKTEAKQAEMKLKHLHAEVKKQQGIVKQSEDDYNKEKHGTERLRKDLSQVEAALTKLAFKEDVHEQLITERRSLETEVMRLREQLDGLESRFPQLDFTYRDPERNFDHSRVKGVVAKLITLKDPKTATALEVAAGGKLYNVVVDTESTGKLLLQKGDLKRRVTIIPLNKIVARSIPNEIARKAEHLVGAENVHVALSLVGYERELEDAMRFVFGNAFVCTSMDMAKKVTFHDGIRQRAVTLAGEVFDPQGTLTGGSRPSGASMLEQLALASSVSQQLHQKEQRIKDIERQLAVSKGQAEEFRKLTQQKELRQRELHQANEKLQQTDHHQKLEDIESMKLQIAECEATVQRCAGVEQHCAAKVQELEEKISSGPAWQEKERKRAEKLLKDAQKRTDESAASLQAKRQQVDGLQLELESIQKDIETSVQQLEQLTVSMDHYDAQMKELDDAVGQQKNAVKRAQAQLQKQKDVLKAQSKEIHARQAELEALRKEIKAAELKLKQLQQDVDKQKNEVHEAKKQISRLKSDHEWLANEEADFNVAGGIYDFTDMDMREMQKRLQKLEETREQLSRNVNMRAMNMLGETQKQCEELLRKKSIVENDKKKIETVIVDLDEKKKEAIKKASRQVNEDFGEIFSMVLPGACCKLQDVYKQDEDGLHGLEIKVGFSGVWKDSLSELSGGQRSLVALSLILAMLLFKPAPIYILDEVDAALDLSHTQNIGHLIRTKFQHSQFIVVSLKDGFFNNANVLFRTKFVDGVSTVARHAQSSGAATTLPPPPLAAAIHKTKRTSDARKRRRVQAATDDDDT